jgi:hypothetical protein
MKSAIVQRLGKEARALFPAWAATSLLIVGSFAFFVLTEIMDVAFDIASPVHGLRDALGVAAYIYAFGAALMGATAFGCEFGHRTMGVLLAQPVARQRIWWEKMAALATALFVSGGLLFWLGFAVISIEQDLLSIMTSRPLHLFQGEAAILGAARPHIEDFFGANIFLETPAGIGLWVILLAMFGFCTGPAMTLLTRSTIAGTLVTLLCPWILTVLCTWLLPPGMPYGAIYVIATQVLYCMILFWVGGRCFQRFEDTPASPLDLSMPAFLATGMSQLSLKLRLGGTGAGVLTNLVKKELRLQWPAFLLAVLIVVYWLVMIAQKPVRPGVDVEGLCLAPFLFCLVIPALAGIVTVAEERNLRVHEWHLTLPVSSRRQWFIKVFVAVAVNAVLGMALPYILAYLVEWRFGPSKDMMRFVAFSFMNVSIMCGAIYASSVSTNCLRALLWAIVFAIPITPIISVLMQPIIDFHGGQDRPDWAAFAMSAAGFLVLFGAIFEMGLARFRRTCG